MNENSLKNEKSTAPVCIYYEDFGAVGDGISNDFFAMKRAHEYANTHGMKVMGRAEKTYLITEADGPISVRTDTDFGGARLIFDDTRVTTPQNGSDGIRGAILNSMLFRVDSDYPFFRADEKMLAEVNSLKDESGCILRGLESGGRSEKINLKLGYPAVLYIKNRNYLSYRRYGFAGRGAPQCEILVIDGEGNIDPSTPMLHDFRDITDITVARLDVRPITIENAVIETRASRVYDKAHYSLSRQFSIERSNVTFQRIEHFVTGELPRFEPVRRDCDGLCYSVRSEGFSYKDGAIYDKDGKLYTGGDVFPFIGHGYYGFLHVDLSSNTHIKSCRFQSRVLYCEGTYEFTANLANAVVLEDCIQTNFFEKDQAGNDTALPNMSLCWGVSGTNYCKNLDFIRSRMTRYDAHAGVVNGKIIDSEISVLRLIGGGDFTMSGTRIYARYNRPIQLREDYGASFNGTLTIKECEVIDAWGTGETVSALIAAPASYWDMGYTCHFPNLIIESIKLRDTAYSEIALVYRDDTPAPEGYYAPCLDIISSGCENPETPSTLYCPTSDPDTWISENITGEGAIYRGLPYRVYDNTRGTKTVVVYDTKNRYPYVPPKFIEVRNNEDLGYQLTLYNSSFFKNTEIRASEENLKRV